MELLRPLLPLLPVLPDMVELYSSLQTLPEVPPETTSSSSSSSSSFFSPLQPFSLSLPLPWKNHSASSDVDVLVLAHSICTPCTQPCSLPRVCKHECSLIHCHPAPCPPCVRTILRPCHCPAALLRPIPCHVTQDEIAVDILRRCGGVCKRPYPACGHPCGDTCHSGPCAGGERCEKGVVLRCKCQKRKVNAPCSHARALRLEVLSLFFLSFFSFFLFFFLFFFTHFIL